MDKLVPHSGNHLPGNARIINPDIFIDVFGSFAQDFEASGNRINGLFILAKLLLTHVSGEFADTFHRIAHVDQIIANVPLFRHTELLAGSLYRYRASEPFWRQDRPLFLRRAFPDGTQGTRMISFISLRGFISEGSPANVGHFIKVAMIAFCTCSRFSASSQTAECGPSITWSLISSPR